MNSIRLFEVGGSIRDELMGVHSDDRDFCAVSTNGWSGLLAWCTENMEKIFQVKPEFFTIRGNINGDIIDIVMCRKDGESTDGRHPDSVEPGTLLDDLSRRDFTINAMAREVSLETLEPINTEDIIDPFAGQSDLKMRRLVSVGNAQDRFEEDKLRLIRAVRFMITKGLVPDSQLERMIADHENWNVMMDTVSIDRVRCELVKALSFNTAGTLRVLAMFVPVRAFDALFEDTGLWLKPTLEKR